MRVFNEKQKFNQWWLKVVMALVIIGGVFPLIFFKNTEETSNPEWLWSIVIFGAITGLTVVLLFVVLQLRTQIDERGVHYAFYPFHLSMKTIRWSDIDACYVREYSPITEFGGWGYRISFGKHGKALNVKGTKGIQLEYGDGKRLLIGTQKSEAAAQTIALYQEKI